jgi:N-acetylglucosamine kinase-like BadF-type ATPase
MALYLGIDGGGTKTRFLLGDENSVIAAATAAGSNVVRSGKEAVYSALHAGLDEVCGAAGIGAGDIAKTVAGLAGSSNAKIRTSLEEILREKLSGAIEIVGDMPIAHQAALQGEPGVLVNSGTGSIAFGRNAKNESARAGGWGFAISDEGSGHWIGRAAIAAAMRAFDAGKSMEYVHHLMAALNVHEPEELALFAHSITNPDFATVFPAIVTIADVGDTTAQKILKHAGEELACLAQTVLDRLFSPHENVAVAAMGGVFQNAALVFDCFRSQLQLSHPSSMIALSDADPALGALMLARKS